MTQRIHQAVIVSSGRIIQVERLGRLLIVYRAPHVGVLGVGRHVSTCRYDKRFKLLPALPGSICGG